MGVGATRQAAAAADPWLLVAATGVLCLQIPLLGFRWWLALRWMGQPASLPVMIRVNTASNVVNFVVPGHAGEAVTSWWLARSGHGDAVTAFSAVIACKVIGSAVNLLVAAGLLMAVGYGGRTPLVALGLGLGVAAGVGVAAVVQPGRGARLGRLMAGLVAAPTRRVMSLLVGDARGRATAAGLRAGIERAWDRLWSSLGLLARRPGALAALTAVSLLKVAVVAASFHLVFRAVGIAADLGASQQVLVSVINDLGRFVFIHVPLDLGGQETVILAGLDAFGVGSAAGLAAALLYKVVTVVEKLLSVAVVAALGPWHPTQG